MPKANRQRKNIKSAAPSKKPYEAPKEEKKKLIKPTDKQKSTLYRSTPKNFRFGGTIQPKRDMTRMVKWPQYVTLQRKRRVLYHRLKVPPSINQFTKTLGKNNATQLFKLLVKYKPETKTEKKERLLTEAKKKAEDKSTSGSKPVVVKYGLNHVTALVEQKKAKLVIIAHDVDPIELVLWLPALCRKREVPYCIVKGKARLGKVVHKKTASCLALCDVNEKDRGDLANLVKVCLNNFNNNTKSRRDWGGGILPPKARAREERKRRAREKEDRLKAKHQ